MNCPDYLLPFPDPLRTDKCRLAVVTTHQRSSWENKYFRWYIWFNNKVSCVVSFLLCSNQLSEADTSGPGTDCPLRRYSNCTYESFIQSCVDIGIDQVFQYLQLVTGDAVSLLRYFPTVFFAKIFSMYQTREVANISTPSVRKKKKKKKKTTVHV